MSPNSLSDRSMQTRWILSLVPSRSSRKIICFQKVFPPLLTNLWDGKSCQQWAWQAFLFYILTLITRSFSETTQLFKTSCPRAQGQLCRSWPGPFPPSSLECRIPAPRPKSGGSAFCGLQLGKKWPDTPFQVLPLLLSAFLTRLTPSS